jgi:hypothetical protein
MSDDILDEIASAKPAGYTPLGVFQEKLVVIVPLETDILSMYKNERTGEDQYQTLTAVIPVESGVGKDGNNKEIPFESGDVHKMFVNSWRVQNQLKNVGKPVVGRIAKGKKGKSPIPPWVLLPATAEEVERAKAVPGIGDKIREAIADHAARKAEREESSVDEGPEEPGEAPF